MAIWEINPMNGPRQVPIGVFSRSVSRTSVAQPEVRDPIPNKASRSHSRTGAV